ERPRKDIRPSPARQLTFKMCSDVMNTGHADHAPGIVANDPNGPPARQTVRVNCRIRVTNCNGFEELRGRARSFRKHGSLTTSLHAGRHPRFPLESVRCPFDVAYRYPARRLLALSQLFPL